MDIVEATRAYEAWLGSQVVPIEADVRHKHQAMATEAFPFLRATFYRWAQRWSEQCTNLQDAPAVLSVGDLHVENFGTWRDRDARLVWGINDLDEAWILPYTQDLVRLAVSAHLARQAGRLKLDLQDVCDALLEGYGHGIETGGNPFVLGPHHPHLASLAELRQRDAPAFWKALFDLPTVSGPLPDGARRVLEGALPEPGLAYRVVHRVAGLGSLGRPRYAALTDWRGGPVAREVKALLPSAWSWAHPQSTAPADPYQRLLDGAVRSPDPTLRVEGRWVVRRLAHDNERIELGALPARRDEPRLLSAMGLETANLHLATPTASEAIKEDMRSRPAHWLRHAVTAMVEATVEDWQAWRKYLGSPATEKGATGG